MNYGTDYNLVTENPADGEVLHVGDRLELTWRLFQTGTWFIARQIDKIERVFEDDGRVKLRSYVYDENAMTLTLEMEITSVGLAPAELPFMATGLVITAGALTVLILTNLIFGAAFYFMYRRGRTGKLYRKAAPAIKERLDDPEVSEGEKEILRRGMEEEPGILETVKTASGAVALVAIVVLVYLVIGGKS